MAIDMSQFLQTFFEESADGLEIMESGLLNLDIGTADKEEINTVFRAAHSIKGGSATFGFSNVASFTHHMETLLDELRDGRRTVTQSIIEILLQSVDCLRELLVAAQSNGAYDTTRIEETEENLKRMLVEETTAQTTTASVTSASAPSATTEAGTRGWRIRFIPHRNLFLSGNDPLRIIAELAQMGEMRSALISSELLSLAELNPEESYLGWNIELHAEIGRSELDEVFAWVEDECALDITPLEGEVKPGISSDRSQPINSSMAAQDAPAANSTHSPRPERRAIEPDRRSSSNDSGSIRVGIEKVDAVINLVSELVITQSMLSTLGENFHPDNIQSLRDGLAQLERNTRELQEDVMRMRMLPISFVFNRFPRLVHDLSQKLGKQVQLKMNGENTEVDKTVVEKLADPLVHLIRNSLDHGIESNPEDRIKSGKQVMGTVNLNAYHKGGNIIIEVKDDGRGLNAEKIRNKAIEKGLVNAGATLSDEECFELIMQPGFSTADEISDVSGRGVGMDVVRKNIQSLGGSIEIHSTPGAGSCFTVRLPLTLAILDGQTIAVSSQNYIVPIVSIVESVQIRKEHLNHVAGRGETYKLRDQYLPVIRLHELFGEKPVSSHNFGGLLMIVESEGRKVALMVDDLLAQQQVVIKSMEANYQRVEGISGATILGDGTVALILDINGVMQIHKNRSSHCAA